MSAESQTLKKARAKPAQTKGLHRFRNVFVFIGVSLEVFGFNRATRAHINQEKIPTLIPVLQGMDMSTAGLI